MDGHEPGHDVLALRHAVMQLWDPIGVADHPEAVNEYDSYLPSIQRELCEGSVDSLSLYLHAVSIERMGLSRSEADDRHAAEALRDWWGEHFTA